MLVGRRLTGLRRDRTHLSLTLRPLGGRRVFLFGLSFALCAFGGLRAHGEQTNCESLPESKRELCWMVVACGALESRERREECYRVAAETSQAPPGGESSDDPPGAEVAKAAEKGDGPAAAREQAAGEEDASRRAGANHEPLVDVADKASEPATDERRGRRWFRWMRRGERGDKATVESVSVSTVASEMTTLEVLTIPRRFNATVTAQVSLVRDRQLLVLDDKLLFEADNRRSSAIDEGERVEVVKASSRRGRSYQIVGQSKRAVTALRLRCEDRDLARETRRKCSVLRRGDAAP